MRLFVAAHLPQAMIDALSETSALLRGSVRGRYVAPDSFHVTLAFLGEVAGWRVDGAVEAVELGCRGVQAGRAALGDLGSFGRRNAATLWQGFSDPGPLEEAARGVRSQLQASGFSFDKKGFLPHVTLMRKADLTAGVLPAPAMADGDVRAVSLFSSDLAGPRPVYEPLHTIEL